MNSKELSNGLLRTVAILASIALVFFLIYQLSSIIIYLIVSVLFTLLGNPIVEFLQKRLKFKNTLAVVTTLVLTILIIIGVIMLFVPLILSQGENLSLLDVNKMEQNYQDLIVSIDRFLQSHGYDLTHLIETSDLFSKINLNFIPTIFSSIVNVIGNIGMGLASVLFISFFFLKDKSSFYVNFESILPTQQKVKILSSIQKITDLLSRYFGALVLQLTIIMVFYLILFLIFGVENAFIIALLCAILNIIPYLGPLLGMIVAITLILLSGIGLENFADILPKTLYVFIGMCVVQLIDNNFTQPILFSRSTKSSPLEIFLVILAAGTLFGIAGMIVAIPTYTALKVIGKEFLPKNKIIQALTKNL